MTLERAGTVLLLVITLAVLFVVGVSAMLSLAADDLFASIDEAHGLVPQTARGEPGMWLSTRLAADVAADDLTARRQRADQLAYRSERVREAASVAALAVSQPAKTASLRSGQRRRISHTWALS